MSQEGAWTVTVRVGTRLVHDGEVYTVTAVDADSVILRGVRGQSMRIHTATLLTDPATKIVGTQGKQLESIGTLLDDLTEAERQQWQERLGHVREVLTGYVSGFAET